MLGDRLLRAALGFVVGAWVARYLGPDRFGHYAYVLAFLAFFQVVAALGADTLVVRDLARDGDGAHATLGTIARLRLMAGIVSWLAAIALMAVVLPGDRESLLMTALAGGALVFQAADTVDLWFQSQGQNRRTVVAKIVAYVITNGFKVALILYHAPLPAFAAAFALDFGLAATALIFAYRRFPAPQRWAFDMARARGLMAQTWPFLLSGLSIMIYIRIDQVMLRSMRGDHDTGIFSAALPISQMWQMIPVTLTMSLAPGLARRKMEDAAAFEAALGRIFRMFTAAALVACALTVLAAPVLIALIYGPRFAASADVLRIYVFTNIFVAMGVAQGLWITNEGAGRLLLVQTLAGAAVAIVGNLLVIPHWGAPGAAAVAVAANGVSTCLVNAFLAPRLFRLQFGLPLPPRS